MSIILLQCRKELIQFARDRLTLALAFVLPLITLLVLGNVIRFEMKNVPVVIQDQDLSPLSRALTQRLSATTLFRPVTWKGSDPVDQALDRNLAKAVIVIPPEFTRRVKARRPAFIQVLIDGIEVNNARLIRNSVIGTTEFLLQSESLSPLEQNVKVNLRIWFNPGRKESLFVVPGVYALVLAAYPALLSAIAMVREKEQGTIMQVYASKATAAQFLGGKAVAYLVVGCLESVFIMLSGFVIFGIYPISDPVFLTLGTLLFLINSVFLGLWMGSRCDTQLEAVQLVALLAFMTTLLFSGFMYPLSTVPFPLSLLSYLVPARYYIEIARAAFVRGTGIEGLWYAPMALSCLALLLVFASWASIRTMRLRD